MAKPLHHFDGSGFLPLPPPDILPDLPFSDVLATRRSAVSGPVTKQHLGTLAWHVSCRRRGGPGRFGLPWEGRASPSAGGLHIISILCIPLEDRAEVGVYDRDFHGLRLLKHPEPLRRANAESVELLCSGKGGTTLQFVADAARLASCYENSQTLLWRDSGALATTICMVATSLGLTSVVLGRTGQELFERTGCPINLFPAGAVHIGAPI